VMRREQPPLIAVVRQRKRDEWVLPKGKLDDGETPRAAARREVLEETGHNVTVHEFLGTLVYESGGRSKIVHYWRMEAGGIQSRALMNDIREVDWLPLDAAVARLSRAYERTFLENVGPLAVSVLSRRLKARALALPAFKASAPKKRRVKPPVVAPQRPIAEPVRAVPEQPELTVAPMASEAVVAEALEQPAAPETALPLVEAEFIPQPDIPEEQVTASDAAATEAMEDNASAPEATAPERQSLAQKVRNWLGRAA